MIRFKEINLDILESSDESCSGNLVSYNENIFLSFFLLD